MDTKRGALAAAIVGSTVVAVDATAVNVALPAIADDLGGGLAGQQWVANAYLLTLSSLILISGSLADLYGERRVFSVGVAGFGVASLLCAIAPTVELLVLARALQGVFGALLTPASLAIIVAVFPESERGAAIGSWTAWGGIGYMLGPLIGGQLVDSASWRWVFFLNLPLVLVTLWLARAYVPQARDARRDPPAARRRGRAAVRRGAGRDLVRADRAAAARLGRSRGRAPARRRDPAVRRVHRLGAARAGADAAARRCSASATSAWRTSRRCSCTAGWRSRASSSCCSCSRWRASARPGPARRTSCP